MAATPQGFRMQTPDHKTSVVDMQPKGLSKIVFSHNGYLPGIKKMK
jgi:hypothetical protein